MKEKGIMVNQKKIKLFETTIKEICKKTKTKLPLIIPHKLKHYTAWCSYKLKLKNYRISYHPDRILNCENKKIIYIAIHEVGHTKTKISNREKSEYIAELFALRNIKKYYPKYYTFKYTKEMINQNIKWYSEAFKKVIKKIKRKGE